MRALLALLALLAPPLHAEGWGDFYRFADRPASAPARAPRGGVAENGVCIREILRAQLRHGIPGNILLGIGLQEAGFTHQQALTVWPWAVNANGEGRVFDSRADALDWVQSRQRDGVDSIDVGCMQINLRWHPDAFDSVEAGFDPAVNVDYAARFLIRLHAQTGDWTEAAGSYHSFTPEKQEIYLAGLRRNVAVANERIDTFRALAAGAPAPSGPAPTRTAEADARPAPRGGAIWSSGLSADGGRRTIYSDADLRPVLPNFTVAFAAVAADPDPEPFP